MGSKVTAILLEGWISPFGGVVPGRVCACAAGFFIFGGDSVRQRIFFFVDETEKKEKMPKITNILSKLSFPTLIKFLWGTLKKYLK